MYIISRFHLLWISPSIKLISNTRCGVSCDYVTIGQSNGDICQSENQSSDTNIAEGGVGGWGVGGGVGGLGGGWVGGDHYLLKTSNHVTGKVWDEITYLFLNVNGCTVEVSLGMDK